MRVLHIITKLDFGGAQSVVRELAISQQIEAEVATGTLGPEASALADHGIAVHRLNSLVHAPSPFHDIQALREFKRLVLERKPDVIHAHSSKAGLVGRLVAWRLGIPVVYTAHGWPFQKGVSVAQRLISLVGESVMSRLPGAVVCVSTADFAMARRFRVVPDKKLHLIRNGIASAPASTRLANTDSDPTLVMVARHAPPKRQDILLNALAQLRAERWVLYLLGDGPDLERNVLLVSSLDIADRVHFSIPPNDPATVLLSSDIGILLSDFEGLPISILEYLRAGVPVLASDLPCSREILGRENSWLVHNSVGDVVTALRKVLSERAAWSTMGEASINSFEENFRSEKMNSEYWSLYLKMARKLDAA